jgi:hypothetical protein
MAIAIAGEDFTEYKEQEEVLKVLLVCDQVHALMTQALQDDLKAAWGWDGQRKNHSWNLWKRDQLLPNDSAVDAKVPGESDSTRFVGP